MTSQYGATLTCPAAGTGPRSDTSDSLKTHHKQISIDINACIYIN
jgi:hypothetical protein